MPEIIINLFLVKPKSQKIWVYRLTSTKPETKNRDLKYRLAAKIAKHIPKEYAPIFSVGEFVYGMKEIPLEHSEEIDIEGTNVSFQVQLTKAEEIDLKNVPTGTERLVNKLVDWYHKENVQNSFHMENVNYKGENIFEKHEARLYAAFKININEGLLRATRNFAGKSYLLLDLDHRVTYEQSLWDEVKFFVKTKLNKDVYLPSRETIDAINERYGRVGAKRGVRVQGKNKVGQYEVIRFDYTKNPETPGTAGNMSQQEYFSKAYGSLFSIKDKNQPLVIVRSLRGYYRERGEIYHVPELLEFDRMPLRLKENKSLMSALTNIQKIQPRGRYSQVINFVQGDPFGKTKGLSDDEFICQFVDVSREPVCVDGQILPTIKLKMGDDIFSVSTDSEFLKNIFKRKFHRAPSVKKIVLLCSDKRKEDVLRFYSMLQRTTKEHDLILPDPVVLTVEEGKFKEYVNALGKAAETDVVLTFTSISDEQLYGIIKSELLIRYGTLSQNITYEKTLDRIIEYETRGNELGVKTILTLIAMQLCAKLGGAPWAFSEPIYDEKAPVIGLDIYHSDDSTSLTSACAVFDPYGEYLFSHTSLGTLEGLLANTLERYIDKFGTPSQTLILRDGLNFTQEQKYLWGSGGELKIIEKILGSYGIPNYVLAMEKKGTHLRMYKKISPIKVENPDSGTAVIGAPFEPNEMLITPQMTYQGTVTPIMYKVIRPAKPDMIKIAAAVNKLSRHHWNTNKAVKIPAPALHADRLTYLIRRVLGQIPTNERILDKPFYL
jgi:hypothetical protein